MTRTDQNAEVAIIPQWMSVLTGVLKIQPLGTIKVMEAASFRLHLKNG